MKKLLLGTLILSTILNASGKDELYQLRLELELAQSAIFLNPQRVCKESIKKIEMSAHFIDGIGQASIEGIRIADAARYYASDLDVYCKSKGFEVVHFQP